MFGGYKFQFTDQNDVTKLDRFDTFMQRHELSSNTIGRVFRGLDELISVEQGEHRRSGCRDAVRTPAGLIHHETFNFHA